MNSQDTLKVNEIFYSIQGESTYAGLPCVFVRLSGCDLRCRYCDTRYAYEEGSYKSAQQILNDVRAFGCSLVELTGGEPLLQRGAPALMSLLCDAGYEVLLETGGHRDISVVDSRVHRIMDIKCPSSGESHKNFWENINYLTDRDEVKFVIGDERDYNWAKEIIEKYRINHICTVLFAGVYGELELRRLAEWILGDNLDVRLELQLHKYIWPADMRGV